MGLPPIDLSVFHDNGYIRKQCRVTGLWFWTTVQDRDTCGDTSEDEYTFIGKPLISGFPMRGKELKDSMREAFLSFSKILVIQESCHIQFLPDGEMIFT